MAALGDLSHRTGGLRSDGPRVRWAYSNRMVLLYGQWLVRPETANASTAPSYATPLGYGVTHSNGVVAVTPSIGSLHPQLHFGSAMAINSSLARAGIEARRSAMREERLAGSGAAPSRPRGTSSSNTSGRSRLGYSDSTPQEKIPPPSPSERAAALAEFQSANSYEYSRLGSSSSSSSSRGYVIRRFISYGQSSGRTPAERFVALSEAGKFATMLGDLDLAMDATKELEDAFEVDGLDVRSRIIQGIAQVGSSSTNPTTLAREALQLSVSALNEDRFDLAQDLAECAVRIGTQLSSDSILKDAREARDAAKNGKRDHRRIAAAREALDSNPDDVQANYILGCHLCFKRDDWQQGLPHLAKCANRTVAEAAQAELDGKPAADIARLWGRAAAATRTDKDEAMSQRAEYWSRRDAGGGATGRRK